MFTGLIEGTGRLEKLAGGAEGALLSVKAPFLIDGTRLGDSVSVNGVCLTVVGIRGQVLTFDVSLETLSSSNLGSLRPGAALNLERALRLSDRLGGHLVTGHVDGIGKLARREPAGASILLAVETPAELMPFIVEKGSVALNGISLTVNRVYATRFEVNIIPHTFKMTTLNDVEIGDTVNIETDLIGKYVARLMGFGSEDDKKQKKEPITMELLASKGFL